MKLLVTSLLKIKAQIQTTYLVTSWSELEVKNFFLFFRSPATNSYYLAQPHGEIYGLDHSMERFQPGMLAKLRPETDIPGLFLSGQDVFIAGFMGKLLCLMF